MPTVKDAFYRAIKRSDIPGALTRYGEARTAAMVDKHMTSALISICSRHKKHGLVQRLWKAHSSGVGATPLTEYLCSDFINGFTRLGDLDAATYVLDTARGSRLANTEVYNSYLVSWTKLQPPTVGVPELESILSQMDEEGIPTDSFTHAIMVGAYGSTGDLAAAQAYVARSGATGDLVISNALMRAAVREDNAQLALSILELLEEQGPVAPTTRQTNAGRPQCHAHDTRMWNALPGTNERPDAHGSAARARPP